MSVIIQLVLNYCPSEFFWVANALSLVNHYTQNNFAAAKIFDPNV